MEREWKRCSTQEYEERQPRRVERIPSSKKKKDDLTESVSFKWKTNVRRTRNREHPVIKTKVGNVDLENVRPRRAGVILYTTHNDTVYFGMGMDEATHDITDFGGGIRYKQDLNVINGALREFDEETLGIFDVMTIDDVIKCPVLYDDKMLIIFIRLDENPEMISRVFLRKYECSRNQEICSIVWFEQEEFQSELVREQIMYKKIHKFLKKAGNFYHIL